MDGMIWKIEHAALADGEKFTLTLSLRDCDCYIYQGNSFLGYMIQTIRQQVMKDKCIEYKQQMQLLPMSIQSL